MKYIGICLIFFLASFQIRAGEPIKLVVGGPSIFKVLDAKKSEIEKASGVTIELKTSFADAGLVALESDHIDAMVIAAPLESFYTPDSRVHLKEKISDFQTQTLGSGSVKIGLNPSNPTKSLNKQQMTDVLSGKIKTWEPINGTKMPVKVVFARSYVSPNKLILKEYLDGKDSPVADVVVDKDGMMRVLQKDPGAIGIFTSRDTLPDFEPTYFESSAVFPLILVTKKTARPDVKKLLEYLKTQPQIRTQ